jgi:heat shock protein HslJ
MQIQTIDGSAINYTSIPPVQPVPPTAIINGPAGADLGQPMAFDGSGSAQGSTPIVSYDWDMGDGTFLNGPTIQYTYNTASSYPVRLRVTDQAGLSSEATQGVQIYPVVEVLPPTAVIEGPSTAFVGDPVTFSAANSQQGTASVTSYQWRSGDGNDIGPNPDTTFTTIYSMPGTYYPEVTVADGSGLSDSASMAIVINAKLIGTDWYLIDTIPGTSILLQFANNKLSGSGGCNNYNAKYTTTLAEGPSNDISIGPISSSQRKCSDEITAQEQSYLTDLQSATRYTINGSGLTLTLADGRELAFSSAFATPAPMPMQ